MKKFYLFALTVTLSTLGLFSQRNAQKTKIQAQSPTSTPSTRSCGTQAPSAEWDAWFNNEVSAFIANHSNEQGKLSSDRKSTRLNSSH